MKIRIVPPLGNLPLFTWAADRKQVCRAATYPARVVSRRYRMPIDRAAVVAELAGFNGEVV